MSADEDTELRDLVSQTLESNGVLGRIRAELRANVFLTLEEQESIQNKTPFLNKDLKTFLGTTEGRLVAGLVQEFLEHFKLEFTKAVFEPETGVKCVYEGRERLACDLSLQQSFGDEQRQPLLKEVVCRLQNRKPDLGKSSARQENGFMESSIPQDLSDSQIKDAQKKFESYDSDKNGVIDKDELRSLFCDIFPGFHRSMLERYVNDEFKATDKDFSNSYMTLTVTEPGIDFEEFLSMYRRLFVQCRSVVVGDGLVQNSTTVNRPSKSTENSLGQNSSRHVANKPTVDTDSSDVEEDPFFDDPVPTSSNPGLQAIRQGILSLSAKCSKNTDKSFKVARKNNLKPDIDEDSEKDELPPLPKSDPPQLPSHLPDDKKSTDGGNLRPLDKRMADMDISGDIEIEYEDDFLSTQSLSQKSPRTVSKSQNENGSIAEEIEEDIEEDISFDADDLLKSQNSAFDDLTTDRTISQHDIGFDYAEDIQLP